MNHLPQQGDSITSNELSNVSKLLQDYLDREFESILTNPTYQTYQKAGKLKVFEEDKLFHIRSHLEGFDEWRILTFNRLQLNNTKKGVSSGFITYLNAEFVAIQNDPSYFPLISQGKLKVFDGVMLFHMTYKLDSWLEWRILSFNELMRIHSTPCMVGSSDSNIS